MTVYKRTEVVEAWKNDDLHVIIWKKGGWEDLPDCIKARWQTSIFVDTDGSTVVYSAQGIDTAAPEDYIVHDKRDQVFVVKKQEFEKNYKPVAS